jgi:hypothetical protein
MSERRPDFEELVGSNVSAEELEQLRRAHEHLLAVGPLPELPLALQKPPPVDERHDSSAAFALFPRRGTRAFALAAVGALMALVIGFIVGKQSGGFSTEFSIAMRSTPAAPAGAGAVINVAAKDASGNWPLQMKVTGLKELPEGGYYVLYLTHKLKPAASCGVFRVHSGETTVDMNAPYNFKQYDGWIVVAKLPGKRVGPTLLTTPPRAQA